MVERMAYSPEAEWQEDIFSAAWGEAAEPMESVSADEAEADPSATDNVSGAGKNRSFEERVEAVKATKEMFETISASLFSFLSASNLASCCAGIFHLHGMGNSLSLGGLPISGDHHHHDDEDEHHHHNHHFVPRLNQLDHTPEPSHQPKPKPVKTPKPTPSSGHSISLGTLVASFASPDILAA